MSEKNKTKQNKSSVFQAKGTRRRSPGVQQGLLKSERGTSERREAKKKNA